MQQRMYICAQVKLHAQYARPVKTGTCSCPNSYYALAIYWQHCHADSASAIGIEQGSWADGHHSFLLMKETMRGNQQNRPCMKDIVKGHLSYHMFISKAVTVQEGYSESLPVRSLREERFPQGSSGLNGPRRALRLLPAEGGTQR